MPKIPPLTYDTEREIYDLWIANIQAQRMSLSGYSFIGSDIGGFAEQPTGELLEVEKDE